MPLIAIDPGPVQSAIVIYEAEGPKVWAARLVENHDYWWQRILFAWQEGPVVIESIASYGMPVGREVFDTCYWIGRFWQQALDTGHTVHLLERQAVKVHLCGLARANDANIRQAILDRFGGKIQAIGRKKAPGPLYGVTGDMWAALAIALTFSDQQKD